MSEEQRRSGIGSLSEGIRTGLGILNAFKEAVEETLQESVDRGDLSPERARQAMQGAADRLQNSIDEARDRFDVVTRREFQALREEIGDLKVRMDRLEVRAAEEGGASESGIIITE